MRATTPKVGLSSGVGGRRLSMLEQIDVIERKASIRSGTPKGSRGDNISQQMFKLDHTKNGEAYDSQSDSSDYHEEEGFDLEQLQLKNRVFYINGQRYTYDHNEAIFFLKNSTD